MSERMVPVFGGAVWVTERGDGLPLLLCNGGPGCTDYLGPVAALLDDVARVIRFEERGCGRSTLPPPFSVEATIADIETIRYSLGHERWVVGGHSWGANLALAYALAHPGRVRALIMVAGTGLQDDRSWHRAYEVGRDAGLDPPPQFDAPPNMEVNRQVMASWRELIKQPSLLRQVANLHVPTLAVHGEEDVRPVWPVAQLVQLMPDARLAVIPGASHVVWRTHLAELGAILRDFLQALPVT